MCDNWDAILSWKEFILWINKQYSRVRANWKGSEGSETSIIK
jgi:hypothetical protein